MKNILMSIGILLPVLMAQAETREYPCYQLAQAPAMDGNIDENAWKQAPEAGGFFILGGVNYALEKQTSFKAGWTQDAIYLAIRCEEPAMDKIKAQLKNGEARFGVGGDDSIELFLYPAGATNYSQLAVNSKGARWNSVVGGMGNDQSLWDWAAKGSAGKDYWTLEVRVPFSGLNKTPVKDERWKINVGRNITTGPATEKYTCWPPLKVEGGFHDIANFGALVFKDAPPAPAEIAEIEKKLNSQYPEYLRKTLAQILEETKAWRDPVNEALKKTTLQKEATGLKETFDMLDQVSGEKDVSPREIASAIVKYRKSNLVEKADDLKARLLLENLVE